MALSPRACQQYATVSPHVGSNTTRKASSASRMTLTGSSSMMTSRVCSEVSVAYCEETTKGEVDHFKPKSRFPKLVYSWSNWLFACHECNHAKLGTWPTAGYVDPCATSKQDHPERHFVIDTQTGRISPHGALGPQQRKKAQDTIDALRLNDSHHLKKRIEWLVLFSAAVPKDPHALTDHTTKLVIHYSSRNVQFSSLVRAWLMEHGYPLKLLST